MKDVIIWGAGHWGELAYWYFRDKGNILFYVDSDIRKTGGDVSWGEIKICSPDILQHHKNATIVIAIQNTKGLETAIAERGIKDVIYFHPDMMNVEGWARYSYGHFVGWKLSCGGKFHLPSPVFAANGANIVDYINLRSFLSEENCLSLLDSLKKKKNRKLAILFGNCQTDRLIGYLMDNAVFAKEFILLRLPAVCGYNEESYHYLEEGFWGLCDLLISQHVSKSNRFSPQLGTQALVQKLPETAKIVWIPNAYFDGYWPQYERSSGEQKKGAFISEEFPNRDKYLDLILKSGGLETVETELARIRSASFFSAETIESHMDSSIEKLSAHEYSCDIKISDFVSANYRNIQLFYSSNHPISELLLVLASRILNFIGIRYPMFLHLHEILNKNNLTYSLRGQDWPIYPSVIKTLGIQKYETDYYPNIFYWEFHGTFDQYMEKYLEVYRNDYSKWNNTMASL